VPWDQFSELFLRSHKAGEHVSVVGTTGSGKSVLMFELCRLLAKRKVKNNRPASVAVLANKPRDATLMKLHKEGWPIVKKWPPAYGQEHCIVWPRGGPPSGRARRLAQVYRPLLDRIYSEGNQTVCIDEASYFERPLPNGLGLHGVMEEYWTSARSSKLSLIAGTQRPRRVTRSMWSEPSWLFVFRPDDIDDLKRVAELSGQRLEVMAAAPRLGGHEFLIVRRQRAGAYALYVSKVGT
jgi:energy-coupling factor transporter ATP-binding protein EcfA2